VLGPFLLDRAGLPAPDADDAAWRAAVPLD
jgi:hypothetical protein